jgi:purine-binding chemotaxis protein CheW
MNQGANGEVQLVVFKLGNEEYGVDITQVREIIKMKEITRIPNAPEFVEGVINLRGQITSVTDLRKRLGIGAHENNEQTRIIIVELDKSTIGMIVDSVSEVLRLNKEDVDSTPSMAANVDTKYIRGVGKLKDRLLILLDLNKVLVQSEVKELETIK